MTSDQHQAVDQRRELGGADVVEAGGDAGVGDDLGQEGQQRGADQGAGEAAEAAEDDRGEQGQAQGQREPAGCRESHGQRHHEAGRAGGARR